MAIEPTVGVFDLHLALQQSSEPEGDVKFAIVPVAYGIVSKTSGGLSVILDRLFPDASPEPEGPIRIHGVRVGLAFSLPDGGWDSSTTSERVKLEIDIATGFHGGCDGYRVSRGIRS